jgi:AraC family L-rhamnose operon transcriptional activator RhaR
MAKLLTRSAHLNSPVWPVGSQFQNHNGSIRWHGHDFIEIAVVLSGKGTHESILGQQDLAAGDFFILRPGAYHTYHDCDNLQLFNCFFGTEFFEKELNFVVQNPLLNYLLWAGPLNKQRGGILALKLPPSQRQACRHHINACWVLTNYADHADRIRSMGHILLLLNCLCTSLEPQSVAPSGPSPHLHNAVDEGIRLFETHMTHAWSLQKLSAQLLINPSYLVRLFKRHTGLAPMQYLARMRAETAAHLLLTSSRNIAEIGEQVGWSDPSYFAERFKAHYGFTANEYRRRFGGIRS